MINKIKKIIIMCGIIISIILMYLNGNTLIAEVCILIISIGELMTLSLHDKVEEIVTNCVMNHPAKSEWDKEMEKFEKETNKN